jgi:5-methylcytosine-specific restriction protein A
MLDGVLSSREPRYTGPDDLTRELVRLRFFGKCCRCGRDGETIQHRIPRGMGGTHDPRVNRPSNLLWVCGDGTRKCHGHMESRRVEAREKGWLVTRTDDPREVPVVLWDGRRVLLDDEGEWSTVPEGCGRPGR